jgi:hypothetical protein
MDHNFLDQIDIIINNSLFRLFLIIIGLISSTITISNFLNYFLSKPLISSQFFMITILIIVLITAVIIGIYIGNKIIKGNALNRNDKIVICLLAYSLILTIFWFCLLIFPSPEITVITPKNGDSVKLTTTVEGFGKYIPNHKTIWVVVMPHENLRYFPQKSLIQIPKTELISFHRTGNWSCIAVFGDLSNPQNASNKEFNVIVVLADEKSNEDFKNYLATNLNEGMVNLPEGVIQYQTINVLRS